MKVIDGPILPRALATERVTVPPAKARMGSPVFIDLFGPPRSEHRLGANDMHPSLCHGWNRSLDINVGLA
jgi:hypothetical protein